MWGVKWSKHIVKRQRQCLRQKVSYHPGSQIIATLFRTTLELPSLLAIVSEVGCCVGENILCVSASVHVCVCEGEIRFFWQVCKALAFLC